MGRSVCASVSLSLKAGRQQNLCPSCYEGVIVCPVLRAVPGTQEVFSQPCPPVVAGAGQGVSLHVLGSVSAVFRSLEGEDL